LPAIWTGPLGMDDLNKREREAQRLQSRAAVTPLPPMTSDWLLKVSILHLYCSQYSVTNHVSLAIPVNRDDSVNLDSNDEHDFAPSGNAVLNCQLYRKMPGDPVLVWERTVAGSAANNQRSNDQLTVDALSDALSQLVKSLANDSPQLTARINSDSASPAGRPAQ
jgi:hypothetical protein